MSLEFYSTISEDELLSVSLPKLIANYAALRSNFYDSEALPTSPVPVEGQKAWNAGKWFTYTNSAWREDLTKEVIVGLKTTDTPIFAGGSYANSNVAHGITDLTTTSVYGISDILSSTDGGLRLMGLSDADATGIAVVGIVGSNNPTDTIPSILLLGGKKNGTSWQAMGSSETVLKVNNQFACLMTILGNGYVGIGQDTPSALLDVNGLAKTTTLKVTDGAALDKILVSDADGDLAYVTGFPAAVNYSSSSTVTGWSSFTGKSIYYMRCGRIAIVWFVIEGTSNSTSASFTLPFSVVAGGSVWVPIRGIDNGVALGHAMASMSGSVVTALATGAGGTWTASGTKIINGCIIIGADY